MLEAVWLGGLIAELELQVSLYLSKQTFARASIVYHSYRRQQLDTTQRLAASLHSGGWSRLLLHSMADKSAYSNKEDSESQAS